MGNSVSETSVKGNKTNDGSLTNARNLNPYKSRIRKRELETCCDCDTVKVRRGIKRKLYERSGTGSSKISRSKNKDRRGDYSTRNKNSNGEHSKVYDDDDDDDEDDDEYDDDKTEGSGKFRVENKRFKSNDYIALRTRARKCDWKNHDAGTSKSMASCNEDDGDDDEGRRTINKNSNIMINIKSKIDRINEKINRSRTRSGKLFRNNDESKKKNNKDTDSGSTNGKTDGASTSTAGTEQSNGIRPRISIRLLLELILDCIDSFKEKDGVTPEEIRKRLIECGLYRSIGLQKALDFGLKWGLIGKPGWALWDEREVYIRGPYRLRSLTHDCGKDGNVKNGLPKSKRWFGKKCYGHRRNDGKSRRRTKKNNEKNE